MIGMALIIGLVIFDLEMDGDETVVTKDALVGEDEAFGYLIFVTGIHKVSMSKVFIKNFRVRNRITLFT